MWHYKHLTELELQLREKDGIIKALQDAFDKQLDIIKMLRDRIDEMTPDDIAKEKGESFDSPFFFIYEVSDLEL